ncbi:hypothetical protein NOCARDAX2BIS_80043 [Nocardioides sp. AX2bis]|nr:hypothetical protein NOCARDAX2BIS_80043 [Nocardioides sp. AX2bis]
MAQSVREADCARREVTWLPVTFTSLNRPLAAWIDSGAQLPPPRIPAELRTLLAEARPRTAPARRPVLSTRPVLAR